MERRPVIALAQAGPTPNSWGSTMLRWLRRLTFAGLLLLGFLYWASLTEAPRLSAGVHKEIKHLTVEGRDVSVTMYYPAARDPAPLVLVAHGFTRSKRYMAGWGADLAAQGFIAAVPIQPARADHELNARVLAELLDQLRRGRIDLQVKPGPRAALVGFSVGSLTTLLAAAKHPVDAWVGLDPVDMSGGGLQAARDLRIPCAILRAEPGA